MEKLVKEKILVLCSRPPFPLVGGEKVRMYNTIKILSKEYEVDVLYIWDNKDNENLIKEGLNKYVKQVIAFKYKKIEFKKNVIKSFIKNDLPLQVNYYYFDSIKKWIKLNYKKYNKIFCNHIRMYEYVKDLSIEVVIDYVDAISMNYKRVEKIKKFPLNVIYKYEGNLVQKYEIEISKNVQKKLLISEVDKNYLIDKGADSRFEILSNYVKEFNKSEDILEKENIISFLGKMDYEPNVSAVKYFVKNIFEKIKKENKKLKFRVIGGYPTEDILKLNNIEGIEVTGFVENIEKYFKESSLFIAPMISGAGIQNKILEAMSFGKCVITTSIGAEGLKNLTGDELIVLDNSEEMQKKIEYLLLNRSVRKKIGIKAKEYIQKNYSEENISKFLLEFIR